MIPRCINDIPPEVISVILRCVIDSYGENIYQKWRCPLLFRCVSRRFYHITTNAPFLWQNLYIRRPLHPYLNHHINHSRSLPLAADVMYQGGDMYEDKTWTKMIDVLAAVSTRLTNLILECLVENGITYQFLRLEMPVINLLDVRGRCIPWMEIGFPQGLLPSVRHLRSRGYFYSEGGLHFPEGLEELHLGGWDDKIASEGLPSNNFWRLLPSKLRVLRLSKLVWHGLQVPHQEAVRLPHLTELHLLESCYDEELSVLQFLHAPRLQTLIMHMANESTAAQYNTDWSLDLPTLTHLEWAFLGPVPRLHRILRKCDSLKRVHIKPASRSASDRESISAFLSLLANDPTFLPLLEDLTILGASIQDLRSLIRARPWFKRLKVHRTDLGSQGPFVAEDYVEWQPCADWLETQVALHANTAPGGWMMDN